MKSTIQVSTNIQLTFNQLVEIAKKLPEEQKVKLATILVDGDEFITKEELIDKIREGLRDVERHREGKIKLRTLTEFLNDV